MLLVFQLRLDIFNHTALDQDIVHIVIKANAHRHIAPCLVRTKMAQTKITDHDGIASIAQANAPFSEACAYSLYGEIADGRMIGLVVEDRNSVVQGKSVSVRVDIGGRRINKK